MSDSAISLGVGSAAQAAASLINTHRQLAASQKARAEQHDFDRAQASTRFGRDLQLEAIRHLRQFELRHLDSELRKRESLEALGHRTLFDTYPVTEGPGHLRDSLRLLAPDLSDLPPVLLLPRFHGSAAAHWSGLRTTLIASLRRALGADGLVEFQEIDGAISWPHAGLYWNDLYGLPALVVQVSLFRDTLDLALGGCHLRAGSGDPPAEPMRTVHRHRRGPRARWTEKEVARLNAVAPPALALDVPGDEEGHSLLEIELAARSVTAVVTAAVDAYWLAVAVRYRQRFDDAVALLGPDALTDWPADLGVPIAQVADPAHHLLTVARREAARGRTAEAGAALQQSLAALTHPDYALTGPPYPSDDEVAEHLLETDPRYTEALRETVAALDGTEDGPSTLVAAEVREVLDAR
ncbi:hypothetical protein NJL88_37190 [Streptomyces sp. DK15]|uniref:hypothetical protein n=1 Tax=Streptomyces sp. DK15 TaxID=2957499 RepID=UPI0029AAB2CE|nr:hypothetical protein [Streptomyces sp. DK15]MDX2395598.1 hypothetical protein [Streptomyces sp. DK15]